MARSGLTKSQVRTVRDRLQAEGRYPSVDAVRHALGDVGSKSTIHKYLKALRDEDTGAVIQRDDTEDALRAVVEQLADRLHTQAEARVRALQAAHAQALRDKQAELAALQGTVAALNARIALLEEQALVRTARDALDDRAAPALASARSAAGFGRFDSGLLSSRSAHGDSSPFGMVRGAARS
jgi:hypothetical protein